MYVQHMYNVCICIYNISVCAFLKEKMKDKNIPAAAFMNLIQLFIKYLYR